MKLFLVAILFAKLIDIHIPSPNEHQGIERREKEKERDRDNEIRQDPNVTEQQQHEAEQSLIRGGHAV